MEQLKYTIKKRLDKMSRTEHEKTMKRILKAITPFARKTFYGWKATQIDSTFEIPYSKLQAIATILGCTIEDLHTPVKQTA